MLDAWLDLVHGSGCVGCAAPGRSLCPTCRDGLVPEARPTRPTPCPPGLAACFTAGEYAGLLRAMVLAHKEHAVFGLARPLGVLLAASVGPAIADLAKGSRVVLVPVPSRPGVVRARGHDPMLRIARAAARSLRAGGRTVHVRRLLQVRAPVADQAGLASAERAANLAGSMGVRAGARDALVRGAEPVAVVVCDDVLTTGATAREAQRALEATGLRVRAVATVAATRKRWPAASGPPGPDLPLSGHAD